jgi:hypothetical protein
MTLQPPDTAPKDQAILGDFGYPWLQLATWNECDQKWAVASMEINMVGGQYNDPYWVTEQENEKDLLGWRPFPQKTTTTQQTTTKQP